MFLLNIGRHMLRQAMEYSGGVNSLVNQGFFFFQLDRSRYVPICGKLSSANHSRPTHWANGYLARYPTISNNLSSTHYTAKKGEGLWSYVGQPKTIGEPLVTPYEADRVRKGFIVFFVPVRESINIKNNLSFAASCFRSPRGIPCPW